MSDFFANVAARARDSQDVVQPRLPSRFEAPESPAAVASGAVPEAMTEREILAPAQSRKPANSRVPREAAPMTAARDIGQHDESRPASVPVTIAAPSSTRPPPDVVTPAAGRVVAADTSDVHVPAAPRPETTNRAERLEPRSDTRPEQPPARAVEPRGRREHDARALAVDGAPRREVAREAQAGERAPVHARAGVREPPAVEPVVPRIAAAVAPPAIQPRIVRATPARTPLAAAPRAAETTIHVSIGRIEVRATPQAVQRGRQAAPSAVMSLGAYLSARAERAR